MYNKKALVDTPNKTLYRMHVRALDIKGMLPRKLDQKKKEVI